MTWTERRHYLYFYVSRQQWFSHNENHNKNHGDDEEDEYHWDDGHEKIHSTWNNIRHVRWRTKSKLEPYYGLALSAAHLKIIYPWCRIYASVNWISIGSGNGLSPVQRQVITCTNAGLLSIRYLGIYLSEIGFGILSFSFKKIHLKLSCAKLAAILSRVRWVHKQLDL